ncbi:uncharacterized protein LOC134668616 [Cydia fagiglandana]|uniref:uncharacterized protein LOC134668616 n=1 Tax=Cydia fagiglandana TaxID=1458189 RepID=UPI002FEE5769
MNRMKGKVAIVTASTEGIGYAIAKRLGNEGASVVICSRKDNNVQRAVKELRREGIAVEGVACHVADAEQRKTLFDTANAKFGGVDILVSNAAVNPGASPMLEAEDATWNKIFEVNVKSSWLLAEEAYPNLVRRGGGSIVFISSIVGYKPMWPIGLYSVSKTALIGLTKAIANEVARDNIRVNCVTPGVIDTKFASIVSTCD